MPLEGSMTAKAFDNLCASISAGMQGTYATALGHTTLAHDKSDRIALGYKRSLRIALINSGVTIEEED